MPNKRTKQLKQIRDQVWNLKKSPLYQYRVKNSYYPVLGEGNHKAYIVFVGEAPGHNEAKTGRPFCGAAGKILDELLASVNIDRSEVYITNIVKDRPPGNRDPKKEEIELYSPFLVKQLETIKPKIIVTLGRFSMEFIMRLYGLEDKLASISQIHGKIFEIETSWGKTKVIPFFHPAVAIYNPNQIETLKKDFRILTSIST